MGRDNSNERRVATSANQGSATHSNASHPPMSSNYYYYQEEQPLLCVPQMFEDQCRVVVPVLTSSSYPSTSGSDSFDLPQHPLPPIHGRNYNVVQHFHHPVSYYSGIPAIPIQNRNHRGSEYQGLTFSLGAYGFQVPMFENGVPPHTQSFGYYTQPSHGNHQHPQHFSPSSQTRGYDNNSGIIHGDNRNSDRLPRRRHHHRSRNHNSGRSQNSSAAEHLGQIPRAQNTSGGHRQAPRFQSSSPTNMINIWQSAASVEIVDEQIIIDFDLRTTGIEEDLPMSHLQYPLEEQTNHAGNGLSEDMILRNLKTSTLLGKQTSQGDEMCIICQDGFQENNRIGTLDCGHVYHADCITKWLEINNQCPLCKRTGLISDTRAD